MRAVLTASMHIFWPRPGSWAPTDGGGAVGGGDACGYRPTPRTPRRYSLIPRRYRPGGVVSRRDSPQARAGAVSYRLGTAGRALDWKGATLVTPVLNSGKRDLRKYVL